MKRRLLAVAPLSVIAYLPLLLSDPGRVAADTKTYLYLDPSRLLSRAWSMWDPNVGLGTVTHQTIGYLWPMGPWFWLFENLGVSDWIAQRLWVGTLMVVAGTGMLYLLRTLGLRYLPALVAAALVYELSPYLLHYAARISVILLPWAALPWLVGLVHRSLQTRSWRYPALFALVVATAGGVNATALVLVGLGPLLWVVFAVLVHREATWREAARAALKIGALTTLCSLWWIAGLWVQGGWGIDILRYTETVETVARTSLASEVLRGLGYWFFYGGDKLGSWIEPGRDYTQHLWLIVVGFAIPVLAFIAIAVFRWRYRVASLALIFLGTAIAVGAYPYKSPSPIGGAFKALVTSSTVGLAMRSTPRAVPLVALGIALAIGSALASARRLVPAIVVAVLAVLGLPPLLNGGFIGENLQRDEDIPRYWDEAAAYLDGRGHDTRVLEMPGTDFASYRWGNTVDPITPGLMDRPYVARELIPYGTPPSADLLIALDRRLQEMVIDNDSLSPIARLLGVGDVVLRSDLQYERYRTPRPVTLWRDLSDTPTGLDEPVAFGPPVPNEAIPRVPLRDEVYLATPASAPDPPPVAVFGVEDPMPIVRARSADAPIVVAGDGEGLVEAAAVGLLGGDSVVLMSPALDRAERATAMDAHAVLVLTDTNRHRGRRWSTMRDNAGYTETEGEQALRDDPSDNRLPLYPNAPDSAFTFTEQRGVASIQATGYGNPVSFTPEDRPAFAMDGDVGTAWQVGALGGVGGERWVLHTTTPVTTSTLNLVQPQNPLANRWITKVEVHLDGASVGTFDLDDRSMVAEGQTLDLGMRRTFSSLELVVAADSIGRLAKYDGLSGVGFAEVRVGDARVDEVIHLPTDLLADGSEGHALALVLARMRSNPIEPTAGDEEHSMARAFVLPEDRVFSLTGEARVSADLADDAVDKVMGGRAVAYSSRRINGDLTTRAVHAIDGRSDTAWTNGFGQQRGDWLEVELPRSTRIDHLDLQVIADGQHSVPTKLHLTTDTGDDIEVDVPAVADGAERDHVARVHLKLSEAIRGSALRVEITDVRETLTTDWYSGTAIAMPVAIAELGLPSSLRPATGRIPSTCRRDLVTIDGHAVGVRIAGSVATGEARQALDVELCGRGVRLDDGEHELRTTPGSRSGFDIDRLVLTSDDRGRAVLPPRAGASPMVARGASVHVVRASHSSVTVDVEGVEPFWLVLGQSYSNGWTASAGLGEPHLVDGYANGWLIEPGDGPTRITLTFAPQRTVNILLVLSALGVLLCVLLIVFSKRSQVAAVGDRIEAPLPTFVAPWRPTGARPRARRIVLVALGGGGVAALVSSPAIGFGVAIALALGLLVRRGPGLLAALSLSSFGLGILFTLARQWRNAYPPDFGWTGFFRPAHHLALVGLLLLAASVAAASVRRRVPSSARPSAAPPGPPH